MSKREPEIHSHIIDYLPVDHPLANEEVFCKSCGEMLHAPNNECMQTWIESGTGNYCLGCFATERGSVLTHEDGLPDGWIEG
jgi:hypothetical protein